MKSFLSVRRAANDLVEPGKEIRLYQSETAEIIEGPDPVQAHVTLWVITGLFASMLLVAAVTRIDRVVNSTAGHIVTVDPTIVLGGLDQSLVKTIEVGEGQQVEAGQLLATLDPTFTTSDVDALKAQVANYAAEIARCKAELAQQPFNMAPTGSPGVAGYVALQRAYYDQRKAQFDAQVRSYDSQIGQQKATLAKYQNDAARYVDRSKISAEIEQMRATLAAAQVGSKLNLLAATDQRLEILRNLESDRNSMTETQHQLDAAAATRAAYIQQWYGDTSKELVTAQGQYDAAVEQLNKATKHQDQVRLVAPADAIVLKMAKVSVHSVLSQGEPLIYLAPLKSPVQAELHISPREIGFIRVGDHVTVKLDAFNYVEHGSAEGVVRWISDGSFTTDDAGAATDSASGQAVEPYYKVMVRFTDTALRNVPAGFRLVPGMTLAGDIHVGSRSVFMYMMRGLLRGFDESMREP
ncbi:MAG TPA: HlyD family type I secretion periplasmic adaptor subunit [Stellaceae bacterium]|jgi:HlyD family secretion protein|nr:HlyD family type I secretion periplasmic adaptor subunit [Stellaceae bacterium]